MFDQDSSSIRLRSLLFILQTFILVVVFVCALPKAVFSPL